MATKTRCWRKALGERGLRVYLFEREPGGNLYREVAIGGERVAPKKSLGHRDKDRAVHDAYELLARLKAHEDALQDGLLTLSVLFDMYVVSPQYGSRTPRTQREDRRKLRRVMESLGPRRDVRTLSFSDVERYKQARMSGSRKVRARAVAADMVALLTMLNWATRERNARGQFLLDVNPLRGVKLPVEKNPRRPVETYDRYLELMEVAEAIDWRLPLALTLAESTGQRIGSILHVRRGDVDLERLPYGWVCFRAEAQKTGYEHQVPLSEYCRVVLLAHLERIPEDLEGWLFPSERKAEVPVARWTMDDYLTTAYERAGVSRLEGGLWHPWRRKWATERKDLPLKDVAAAGGWRDYQTLLRSYQQIDTYTLVRVALEAPKLRSDRGALGSEVTPKVTPLSVA